MGRPWDFSATLKAHVKPPVKSGICAQTASPSLSSCSRRAAMGLHVAIAAGTSTPIVGIDLCFAAADSALLLVAACLCILLHPMRDPHYPQGTRLCSGHGDGGRPHASPPGRQGCCGRSSQRCRRPASFMTTCNAALLGSDTAHERPAARYVETTVCDPVPRGSMYRAPIVVCDPEITDVDKRDTSTT